MEIIDKYCYFRFLDYSHFVFSLTAFYRFYWNVIMLILLMANLIMLPVIISFFNDDLPGNWLIFNSISDTLFILDIIVNFRTGELYIYTFIDVKTMSSCL